MVVRVPVPGPVSGRRRVLLIVAGVVAGLLLAFTALTGFFVDVLWFREVGFSDVFWSILRTKVLLGVAFGVAFFVLLYVNLWIVRRITPRYGQLTPEQEVIERYRMQFEPYIRWLLPLFALVIAVFVGIGVTGQWQTYLLWRNGSGLVFGNPEPLFGRDPSFYVFSLPWLKFMQGWLFSALVGVTLLTALAHYLWGGIRPQAPAIGEKVSPQVKAHLSVLLGLIMLTKAWGYYLGQFDLLTSTRGVVVGASYTDVNAQLPALRILVFIAIACAILFLVNIRLRGWALPVIAVGLLALVSIIAGAAYPAFVQRFRVAPQEFQREQPFIVDNIEATRRAFQLDTITTQARPVGGAVTAEDVEVNRATISNIRLWRPNILRDNFTSLQRFRSYYEFNDVDVDRYTIDGQPRVLMVSTREVSHDGIPEGGRTWQNVHLVYTHGFGAVTSQVNSATSEGQPIFTLRDIPPEGEPAFEEGGNGARVYYGEGAAGDAAFVVVGTGAGELDYQGTATDDQEQVDFTYDGDGGIPVGGLFQRALFAWRFRDVNLLISDLIQGESRIMIYRGIQERVPKAAPFLRFDADPYAAVVEGRLVWIWDAYTLTDQYPYSDFIELSEASTPPAQEGAPSLVGEANYIRNSVKVVVDGYDGSIRYYVADPDDPIIQAWGGAFPELLTPIEEAPSDLLAHFRYPENLFQVQAVQYTNYHVTNPDVFYGKQDFWAIPVDPTISSETSQFGMRPYYVLMRLPGDTEESFVLILPFTPQNRQNMVAWMAAQSDPAEYGQLVSFQFPSGVNVDGPTQIFSRINQDARFSAERTLLGQGGSSILFGDFLVIPLEDSLLYVQPVYVQSNQPNAIPELRRVVVVNGSRIGLGATLTEALEDSVSGAVSPPPPPDGGEEPPPEGSVEEQIQSLLDEAAQHFAAADAALREGDLATYQTEIEAAQEATADAQQLIAGLLGVDATTTPSPSPSPTG